MLTISQSAGYVRLPQLEIVSLTYNMPFTTSDERRELFVLPQECSEWKSVLPDASSLSSSS